MNDKKIILSIVIFSFLLIGGGVLVLSNTQTSPKISASQNAKVEISETKFDWGEIDYNAAKATKTFKIKNSGTENLKLSNIKTSCTCTTAQVITEQSKSPLFNMHSVSSWVGEVASGKEADLVVVFDQAFHGPSGVGPIERLISVETNDSNQPKLEFTLTGNVVKK